MRYPKDRKETSREKIIDAASRAFRANGIAATGIDEVMRGAGLTKGAFSTHFRSKDDLVAAAIAASANASPFFDFAADAATLEQLVSCYLEGKHRDHPEEGCPVASLAPEVARLAKGSRAPFVEASEKMVEFVGARLPKGKSPSARREAALAVLATMIGTLQLARMATSREASERILELGRKAAVKVAA